MEERPGWGDTAKIIALVIVVAFNLLVFTWMFFPPTGDPGSLAVLNTLVGAAAAGFGMVLQYFFGSSKTSSTKDETIAKLTNSNGNGNGNGKAVTADSVAVTGDTVTVKEN